MPTLFHVDAFAAAPFSGNPAAVCLLERSRETAWMQGVAREMNVSETAFVLPEAGSFRLRWFTPEVEVDLCGHATLAAAHVLWETGRLAEDAPARFDTRSGVLTAERREGWIELDFPATPCVPAKAPEGYREALGIEPPIAVLSAGPRHIVQLASTAAVKAVAPDFGALRARPGRGIAVTAQGDGNPFDFVSRYFAPWVGVDEDPVTGSVHCALAVFWSGQLGKREMLAQQASKRGGELRLRLEENRVRIGGRAVTVARGDVVI